MCVFLIHTEDKNAHSTSNVRTFFGSGHISFCLVFTTSQDCLRVKMWLKGGGEGVSCDVRVRTWENIMSMKVLTKILGRECECECVCFCVFKAICWQQ